MLYTTLTLFRKTLSLASVVGQVETMKIPSQNENCQGEFHASECNFAGNPSPDAFLKTHEVSLSGPIPLSSTSCPVYICFSSCLTSFCYLEEFMSQGTSSLFTEGMCVFPLLDVFSNCPILACSLFFM